MPGFDGVIFDMDGTLIEPLLDFAAIRRELSVPATRGILETIEAMDPARRDAAHRLLLDHELTAAGKAQLMPGAAEVLGEIRHAGLRTALLTRNAEPAMRIVLQRFETLRFDLTWSRENGPIKPEPDGVLRACRELGITPDRTACVGDFHYDIRAANDAGAVSILLATGPQPDFADEARHVIAALTELPALLGI